jgi:hypothetical protein
MERWFDEAFRRSFSLFHPLLQPRLRFPAIEEFSPSVDIFLSPSSGDPI